MTCLPHRPTRDVAFLLRTMAMVLFLIKVCIFSNNCFNFKNFPLMPIYIFFIFIASDADPEADADTDEELYKFVEEESYGDDMESLGY